MILELCKAMFSTSTEAARIYWNISARYREPHRKAHTLNHIDTMLKAYNHITMGSMDFDLILAILFHDFVYNVDETYPLNEDRSAQALAELLPDMNTEKPRQLILSTKVGWEIDTKEEKVLHDLDYMIFSGEYMAFKKWDDEIEEELGHFKDFKKLRADFLKRLLKTEVFLTQFFDKKNVFSNIEQVLKEKYSGASAGVSV